MIRLAGAKLTTLFAVKLLPAIKLSVGAGCMAFVAAGALTQSLPVQDIWFDYVLFIILSAIVGGMP